ncbi:MAG TPA: hypothetical protein VFC26_14715, partial [Verrucomicrobiae bacterium]|nr:hypothetical protein [Verrucomicrobiae bacterium]
MLVTVLCLMAIWGRGATVSWDGGGGNNSWHTAANWSGNTVPGLNDDIVIDVPGDITVVHSNGTTIVRSVQCQEGFQLTGGTLTVTAGASIVNGALRLGAGTLIVRGAGATFTGNGATTNETANLTAELGGHLSLPGLQRVTRTVSSDWIITVRDTNSIIDLPNLTQVSVIDHYQFTIRASQGGRVNLPALTQVNAIDARSDRAGSVIDLSGLQGALRRTIDGSSSLEVLDGGAILIPNVTALEGVGLYITGSGQIATAQLTAITGAELSLTATTNFFPNVTNIIGNHLTADGGARLTL